MNIVGNAVARIDTAAKRICVVTGCGIYRARKVLQWLSMRSDRTAVVVRASDRSTEPIRVVRKAVDRSSVVTVRGRRQSCADLLKQLSRVWISTGRE